ncbi:Gfo/Idh/MocA family protein [Rhizobium leguminosarum]|uniref:Gfo/Idh/MocA family protein n=1 Tax=Rhizobium leguminosarum TaxID=384 RepID=UPI0014425852|nr:Gfo/Idh/MocA family oxidoreductase [Rhizobium leguminosarum]NKK63442.1 gfo/Idh/MocA family oxidoreductase [Rhizobium leguminosarum bv. viciae]NKL03807.1 gfo/Idh/MocA family oxidoreductase [Rhizobium leguminosarum bv. viciae]NKL84118.1 gfo/Idh/MocA family oxidoreductase [Rhizobium leguminosarum bv. viciae]NKL88971.1 gfo/Idh/MocA family oxidoreductase [Rhizobium leguminosarum bv. viciae]NKM89911.1 gfo/Idh/MocA family oxidoreductase [Rhizobium leguminosarum bv. viciae]
MTQTNGMKLRIGVVGCGSISLAYMRNAPLFRGVEIIACADLNADAAKRRAAEFDLRAADVDSLIDDRNIDLILNLTIPAAHFDVSMRALSAGKHVFTEKPLGVTAAEGRRLVDAAAVKGLMLGSAPDTFLGAAGRHARRQMEAGAIGKPVTGTAFMMGRGMEHWHPDPSFYYQAGAGPVMDMGPYYLTMMVNLMGPIRRVQAVATSGQKERLITAEGPKQGTKFKVGTPTSVLSLLEFDCGATVTFGTSWDVFRHSNHAIELHGAEGSLRLPDPDNFGGSVALSSRGAPWQETDTSGELFGAVNWPIAAPDRANYRMLGLADLARAIIEGGAPRASGDLALHVLEVMEAILRAGETGVAQTIPGIVAQPKELREDEARSLLK